MIWKTIPLHPYYKISEFGNVKNTITNKILKHWILRSGYCQIELPPETVYTVHRLVLTVFNPNGKFDGAVINHLDGDKENNHISNLEWCSQSDNIKHDYRLGIRNKKGEKHHLAKFTNMDILSIRRRLKNGEIGNSIAKEYGVCHQTISQIKTRKTWA